MGCDLSTEPNRSASPVISIHAPQWGATAHRPTGVRTHSDFNPRTPVGCDGIAPDKRLEAVIFQSTHPSGVRHAPFENPLAIFKFQSTHPSGVRPYALRLRFVSRDFNPRTPVGCDPMSGCRFGRLRISIHAPQWGATATPSPSLSSFVISIHAPQWGATGPYGCVFGVVVISIHAPQWGATRAALEPWARVANFNPRTPVGCDVTTLAVDAGPVQFQSTHPSGVRPLSTTAVRWLWHFNPRTPVGCDCRY